MKQPKFNHGNLVKRKDSSHMFLVNGIHRWTLIEKSEHKQTFAYNSTWNEVPVMEEDLELYQEPQKQDEQEFRLRIEGGVFNPKLGIFEMKEIYNSHPAQGTDTEPQKKKQYGFIKQHRRFTHIDGVLSWEQVIMLPELPSATVINTLEQYEKIYRAPDYDIEFPVKVTENNVVNHGV